MRLTNWIVEKVGADKILHFAFGALGVGLAAPAGIIPAGVAAGVVIILSSVKEFWLDDEADGWDLAAGTAGALLMTGWTALVGGFVG